MWQGKEREKRKEKREISEERRGEKDKRQRR